MRGEAGRRNHTQQLGAALHTIVCWRNSYHQQQPSQPNTPHLPGTMCLPPSTLSSVVLPAPLGPISRQVAPRGRASVMPCTTGARPARGRPSAQGWRQGERRAGES